MSSFCEMTSTLRVFDFLYYYSHLCIATMVGGAYINGTAEAVGRDGIVWAIAPVSYNIGIAIGIHFAAQK